nr:MAG TPA: hypothetical protein [Caudoviricetes sp.]
MSDNNINTISYSFKNYINSFKSNSKNNGQYISINHRFYMMGVLKTKMIVTFWQHLHSWLFHTLTQKCNLISNLKIPKKIKQNPKFHHSNHLSYPISSIHLFYKPFIHFNP